MNVTEPFAILEKSFEHLNPYLNHLVITILILLTGLILGRVLGRLVYVLFREIKLDYYFKRFVRIDAKLARLLSFVVSYAIYAAAFIIVLDRLRITGYVLYAFIGILLVVFVMSAVGVVKDFLPNLLSGFNIRRKRLFKEGDVIILDNLQGKIKRTSLLETQIITSGSDRIVIPNSLFSRQKFKVKRSRP